MKNCWIYLLLLCVPRQAFALCVGMTLSGVPGTVTFQGGSAEYSVYDAAQYLQTINFTVNGGAQIVTCDYVLALSTGGSGNASQRKMYRGATTLNYNAYVTGTTVLMDIGSAGPGNVISGSFPLGLGLGQTQNKSFTWTITPSQVVSAHATRFQDTPVTLTLYSIVLGLPVYADHKDITFRAKAESSVELSLVDTNTAFNATDTAQTIDFGNLSSGQSLSYDTMIRSNDGYIVTLQSHNKQKMAHDGAPTVTSTVDYNLSFNGSNINLTSGAAVQAVSSGGATTPAIGTRFPTQLTVGTLSGGEAAGNYQDVIDVTVSAH